MRYSMKPNIALKNYFKRLLQNFLSALDKVVEKDYNEVRNSSKVGIREVLSLGVTYNVFENNI